MTLRSGMCDVAQKEFIHQLSEMGLQFREVQGDGNCLFRALGDQLEGNSRNHFYYRQETADYMMKNRRDFEPFLEDNCAFEDYVHKLQREGTYAGNDAIVAFARRFDVNVIIHQVCAPLWIIEGGCCHAPELHIAYYNGDHYASIRRFGDDGDTPARIWLRDLKKYRKERRKRRPANSNLRRMVQHIMNVTECVDSELIEQLLGQNNYDVDQTIVRMTENNPCIGGDMDDDIKKDCRYRADGKRQRFSSERDVCGATTPEECVILSRASNTMANYDRGRSPKRKSIMKSRSQSRSSSGKSSSKDLNRSNDSIGAHVMYGRGSRAPANCDIPVYTYTGHPRNQTCNLATSDENIGEAYSDHSSGAGHTREASRFKERGEIRDSSPSSSRKILKSPKRSKSPKSVAVTAKSSRHSARSRSRESSPKSSKIRSANASPKASKRYVDRAEDEETRTRIRNNTCEQDKCPLGLSGSQTVTVIKSDASPIDCDGPPCPKADTMEMSRKDVRKSSIPIICRTLSDAVMSTASSSSDNHIDKANCILRGKRSSDTWLNVTLGILVAFLVLCLIRIF